ncbi:4'-phosphopantetheinyl transferase family protein [Aquimarina agarivorans]|uniref:4'-phosphopantetheinyl transferase family protein n=1 Tax=Aquimarina agarivorans TaxID=980584 RepID=UPI001EE65896|nr:4'-phosphopantetheinyl transferase superfamily protein [Aquimarina agarivorans]
MLNFLPFFSEAFRKKIKKYKKWEDAQLSLMGRLLLKEGLEKNFDYVYNDNEIDLTSNFKPYFKSKKVQFNISHSGSIVVCAISREYDIGIDIEIIKDIEIEHFKSHMTDYEWSKIMTENSLKFETFFNYWTQKEAAVKANGKGLYIPLKSFEVKNCRTIIENNKYIIKELKIDSRYKCNIGFREKNDFPSDEIFIIKLVHFEF